MNKRIIKKKIIKKIQNLGVKITYGAGFNQLYNSQKYEEKLCVCGEYRRHQFIIVSFNGRPNAYVTSYINLENLEDYDYMFDCHGGITYHGKHLFKKNGRNNIINVIGWDYGHLFDYQPYSPVMCCEGMKHSLQEIVEECISVIDQMFDQIY